MFSKDANANNQLNLNNQATSTVSPLPGRMVPYMYGYTPSYSNDPSTLQREDDLFGFIEKQSEYIAQLEKETKYSRDELASMLDKVKDVIAENEELHQKQKTDLLTKMIQHLNEKTDGYDVSSPGDGKLVKVCVILKQKIKKYGRWCYNSYFQPRANDGNGNVILESKIAELEAQLSQARRNLRLAQEEVLELRKGSIAGIGTALSGTIGRDPSVLTNTVYANCDLHRAEIETLVRYFIDRNLLLHCDFYKTLWNTFNREKSDLLDTLQKMKHMSSELRDRESEAAKKVKNSLEIVEQMQVEKAQVFVVNNVRCNPRIFDC